MQIQKFVSSTRTWWPDWLFWVYSFDHMEWLETYCWILTYCNHGQYSSLCQFSYNLDKNNIDQHRMLLYKASLWVAKRIALVRYLHDQSAGYQNTHFYRFKYQKCCPTTYIKSKLSLVWVWFVLKDLLRKWYPDHPCKMQIQIRWNLLHAFQILEGFRFIRWEYHVYICTETNPGAPMKSGLSGSSLLKNDSKWSTWTWLSSSILMYQSISSRICLSQTVLRKAAYQNNGLQQIWELKMTSFVVDIDNHQHYAVELN